MTCRLIWYFLFDFTTGLPFKGTSADCISVPTNHVVAQLKKDVKKNNSSILTSVDASDLIVYANESAFKKRNSAEGKEQPLKSSSSLSSLGESEDEAPIVVVPTGIAMSQSGITDISTELYHTLTQPFPQEPHINDLMKCLSSDPLIQIPVLSHRHSVVTRYCFEPGMAKFKNYFCCSYTDDHQNYCSSNSL